MAYTIPSLSDLSQKARGYFAVALGGAVSAVWPNTWYVLAKVLAYAGRELHLRFAWLFKQIFASTADEVWLRRHGYELGVDYVPAIAATGAITVSSAAAVTLLRGTRFERADGADYLVALDTALIAGDTAVAVTAVLSGAGGNTAAGTVLTLADPDLYPDVTPDAPVASGGLGGGADTEDLEHYRSRVLARKRKRAGAGNASDWDEWAKGTSGAISATFVDSFVNSTMAVWLTFLRSDRTNGIPTNSDVAALQAALDSPLLRPVQARVTVVAPTPVPIAVTIANLSPANDSIREAIAAELAALFADSMSPATPNRAFVLPVEWISAAIAMAPGVVRFTLIAPSGDIAFSVPGQYPVLGAVTYA